MGQGIGEGSSPADESIGDGQAERHEYDNVDEIDNLPDRSESVEWMWLRLWRK